LAAKFCQSIPELCELIWPLAVPVLAFVCFIIWNGSIVVGDKVHHKPLFSHWAMPLHMLSIASLLLMPTTISDWLDEEKSSAENRNTKKKKKRVNILEKISPFSFPLLVCGLFLTILCLQWGSISHPFLLSDNRHYTFYIWKRFLDKSLVRLIMSPFYFLLTSCLLHKMVVSRGAIWVLGFLLIAIATLVTTPLLEPRYFTPGVVMLILNCQIEKPPKYEIDVSAKAAHTLNRGFISFCVSIFACCVINVAVIYTFIQKPFTWMDGSTARFMF